MEGIPETRRGTRYFDCPECKYSWSHVSRDAASPSGKNCPKCGEFCQPTRYELDSSISVDRLGNLIEDNEDSIVESTSEAGTEDKEQENGSG